MTLELLFTPNNQLNRVDMSPEGRIRYSATGTDPYGALTWSGGMPISGGWHVVHFDFGTGASPSLLSPQIYADYGRGFTEDEKIPLPFRQSADGRYSAVVRLQASTCALRFDPDTAPVNFELGPVSMRRISRFKALTLMMSTLFRRTPSRRERLHIALGFLRDVARNGVRNAGGSLYAEYTGREKEPFDHAYSRWLRDFDRISGTADAIANLSRQPVISVVVPVYNTPEKWLRKCIQSVLSQTYPHWELCIADDASTNASIQTILREYAGQDTRIRLHRNEVNRHISETSNAAVALANGEFIALLDHDDELHPDALFEIAAAVNRHPDWRVIFTDEDKIDEEGSRYDPYFKPDWNYDLFLSHNCISHLGVYETALIREVGGFTKGMEGSQDWDLALRCIERLKDGEVGHVPRVLYHWRAIPGSTALAPGEKSYAHLAAMRAIDAHLQRINANGRVHEIGRYPGNYRVKYELLAEGPQVSIIIPTRDNVDLLRTCVESIISKTEYENFEIIIVDNGSSEERTHRYLESVVRDSRVRVLPYPMPFNYSAINNHAVSQSGGEVVVLMNNDIEVIKPDWLEEMVSHALRPGVGAVGAMLYYPDDSIQHAGVVLGFNGVGVHAYAGKPRGWTGHKLRARLIQSMTAVTGACLAVRKDLYLQVGGMDEALRVAYNDIDFCLKLSIAGHRCIWTPYAELYHHESASRGSDMLPENLARFRGEADIMQGRWERWIAADPNYSVNFALSGEPYTLAFPPRGWS